MTTKNRGKVPLFLFGSEDDLSTWSPVNVTVTGSQADLFGGTDAFLLDVTVANGYINRNITEPIFSRGQMLITWFVKNVDATTTRFIIRDNTAAVNRVETDLTWSGMSHAVAAGSGAALVPIDCGGGWYLVGVVADSLVAGNSHSLTLRPTGVGTDSIYAYRRSVVAPGWPLDGVAHGPKPSPGSKWARAGGQRDAWITGTDYMLTGVIRWIPSVYHADPPATGWDSDGADVGCNAGVEAMLISAWDENTIRFVPDRLDCALYHDVNLQAPREAVETGTEDDGTSVLTLSLIDSVPFVGF